MKKLLFVVVMGALAACASNQKSQQGAIAMENPGPRPPESQGVSKPPIPCAQEIAFNCPVGVDGCIGGKTLYHVCVPQELGGCATPIALACPEGQIDACLLQPPAANGHICVYK